MRVGLLTTSYPTGPSSFRGIFVKRLVDELREQGVDVDVIEPAGYHPLKRGSGLVPNLKTSLAARLLFPWYCLHFLIIAIARARRCDLLHANWSLAGFFAVVAGRLARRKVLLTERSRFLIEATSPGIIKFVHWVMARSDRVVTISDNARTHLVGKYPEIPVDVIPNGVDAALFHPDRRSQARAGLELDSGAVNMLSVGRLTAEKKLDVLIAALNQLAATHDGFHLWMIGEGELRSAIEQQAEGLRDRVTLLGALSHQEVARWMCGCDMLVFCSEGESGGNTLLEAMSAGLAVVSTPVGWANDYIENGTNGLLTPIGDVDSLTASLQVLVNQPGSAREMGRRARETIEKEKLTWSGCAQSYIKHYRDLAAGASR